MTKLYLQAFNILQESLQIYTGYGMIWLREGMFYSVDKKQNPWDWNPGEKRLIFLPFVYPFVYIIRDFY